MQDDFYNSSFRVNFNKILLYVNMIIKRDACGIITENFDHEAFH
jgi:hypothetical protein